MQEKWVGSLGLEDPREGNGNPLQYSCLGNPKDSGAWWATVHGVTNCQTQLSNEAQDSFSHTHSSALVVGRQP